MKFRAGVQVQDMQHGVHEAQQRVPPRQQPAQHQEHGAGQARLRLQDWGGGGRR